MKRKCTESIPFQYEKQVRGLLEQIRGQQTQKQLSSLMGYSFNQWHKWETGEKNLMWQDFVKISQTFHLPLTTTLEGILGRKKFNITHSGEVFFELWRKFGTEKAKHGFFSEAKYCRLIKGSQDFEMAHFLKILSELSSTLDFFIQSVSKSPHLDQIQNRVQLEADHPLMCVIEGLIETQAYRKCRSHNDSFFVDLLGIHQTKVRQLLKILEKIGSIEKKSGKYILNDIRVDMEPNIQASAKLAHYWTQVCAHRFETESGIPPSGRGWSYRIFPISKIARDLIREKIQHFVSDLNRIIVSDETSKKELVQVMMLHFFDHTELKSLNLKTSDQK